MTIINKVAGQLAHITTYDPVTGEVTGFTPVGNIELGPVTNISITGGTAGQALVTDGNGNLQFADVAGSYGDANVSAYLQGNITTNIIPATATQSLGSLANPWNELYVSGNTIFVAGVPLSLGANTSLEFDGIPLVQSTGDTNITTTGNVEAAAVTAEGNITANPGFFFIGDGGLLANLPIQPDSYSNSNVANYLPIYTGDLRAGNAILGNAVYANFFIGAGNNLSNIQGANVIGNVANAVFATTSASATNALTATVATTAHQVDGANVDGAVAFATVANSVAGANVTGEVALANYAAYAGNITIAAQPNVTSVGTLVSLAVSGNVSAGNVAAGNLLTANFVTGTLTTASQPNVTSVGTLVSLAVSGNAEVTGNVVTDDVISLTGDLTLAAAGTNQNIALVPTGTGYIDASSAQIKNLQDPVDVQDAATKGYVDATAEGLSVQESCLVATNNDLTTITGGTVTYNNGTSGVGATLTLSTALTALDGVTLAAGDRILVKSETNAAYNGIYTWATGGTVLTRATDFDDTVAIVPGDFVFVSAGTQYENTGWVQTSTVATVGTSDVVFTQFSGAGAYTAGTGLTLSGTQFSITNTAVTAGTYGNASTTLTATVNQQGQLTSVSQQAVIANAETLTGAFLNSDVQGSNLTSVGTLTGLAVNGDATVVGNIDAGNLYANSGAVGATTITATGTLSGGNISTAGNVTASYLIGNGSALVSITGANVTGAVAFATTANSVAGANVSGEVAFAATANSVAGANVTGTVASATIAASANSVAGANVSGEVAFAAVANSVAGANVTGTVSSATVAAVANAVLGTNVSGEVAFAAVANSVAGANVTGEVAFAAIANSVAGANVTGTVANATFATTSGSADSVAGANVTGEVAFAAVANSVAGANVTGTVANATFATTAGTADSVAGANVTGTVANATFATTAGAADSVAGANVSGQVANALVAATVYEAAQPNITSVGTLVDLTVNSSNTVSLTGGGTTSIVLDSANGYVSINQNANIDIFGNITTPSDVTAFNMFAESMIADTIGNATSVLFGDGANITGLPAGYANSDVANLLASGTLTSNIVTSGNIFGGYINGDGSGLTLLTGSEVTGEVTFAATANSVAGANVSGEVGFAAVANSVAGANVTGTVASATVAASANSVAGANVSGEVAFAATANSVAGANVVGTVASATVAATANSVAGANVSGQVANALVAGTVYTAAQPAITSVGTLTALSVSGNATVSGNLVTDSVVSNTGTLTLSASGTNQNVTLAPTGTGVVDVSSTRITDLASPVDATDAATKSYVDSVAEGLNVKEGCVAATPADLATLTGDIVSYNNGTAGVGATLTLDTALTTLDGVTLANGDRILVKSEATPAWNGIYTWATGGTVLTRSTDYDTPTDISSGSFVFIGDGALYAGTGWVETDVVTTVGTSSIDFTQFSGAGSYSAGAGLELNGTEFSVANTTVTAGTYGNASQTVTMVVNSRGQLTSVAQQAVVANAETLTGTTLNSTVVSSSLTSVGTLTGLTVSGTTNLGAVGNLTITGGANGRVLTTNGSGVLSWASGTATWNNVTNKNNASGPSSVAIGLVAGFTNPGTSTVAIGIEAGSTNQGDFSVAMGVSAAYTDQGAGAVAIGSQAAYIGQGNGSVAIGEYAGYTNQGSNSVALGAQAGNSAQVNNSIIINATGLDLPSTNAGLYVAPVRNDTGNTTNTVFYNTTTKEVTYATVSAGTPATIANGTSNVRIAASGGNVTMGVAGVANAFVLSGSQISIGNGSGGATQSSQAIAIGQASAYTSQGQSAVAIGYGSAQINQGQNAVAIGSLAADNGQGANAVALGKSAGGVSQGIKAVAIGSYAGQTSQGANSIAIGANAGYTNQPANTIILNATGANLNGVAAQTDSFYVNPVRNDTGNTTNVVYYNTTTKEVTYGPTAYGNANVSAYLAGNTDTAGYLTTGNITTTANIAATGNISSNGNIIVNGTIGTGNISGANNISGLTLLASNAILVGSTVTTLPNTVARFGSNSNSYTQITFQNLSTGTDATSDIVLTTDNGNDTVNFADFGIINSAYDPLTPTNSLGNVVFAGDAYLYAQGNTGNTAQSGGNLVLGATVSTKNVKIFAGGNTNAFVTATFTSTAANLKALNVAGTSNLGPVGNVTITGGTAGQVLTTNGSNVLSWTTVSGGGGGGSIIANGTSNVSIAAVDGNITFAINGNDAGKITSDRVAIGQSAGILTQSADAVAVGSGAGQQGQGSGAIAIGSGTAYISQGVGAIAIGNVAAQTSQGQNAIAIGAGSAGAVNQGANSIVIGVDAGFSLAGINSVAIGSSARAAANTIVLNATGTTLIGGSSGFYAAPVRNDTGNVTNAMYYNTTTKEVTYGPAGGGGGSTTIDRSVITGNVTLALAQAGTFLYSTTTTAQAVTIPTNASVAFPIGTSINVILNGTGSVELTPASGVSLYLAGNSTSATRTVSPYGVATLLQVDTNVWFVNGSGVY